MSLQQVQQYIFHECSGCKQSTWRRARSEGTSTYTTVGRNMGSDSAMLVQKKGYLVVYDYGSGGVWAIIIAESRLDILKKFPQLKIIDRRPEWMSNDEFDKIKEEALDIDSQNLPDWLLRTNN